MLSDCSCTIDTREKNQKRIEAVKSFIESHNGCVEFGTLNLCDYKIEGIFREKEVCIGIEAKSLTDFSGSYQDLPDKLARSFELYNDVCLFVEIPQFRTSSEDNFHAMILNEAVQDGSANVLQYAVLQNSLASWQSSGVHVRQLQSELFWGYAMASVLISITKGTHRGLEITKNKDFKSQYINILTKFDGIGQKTAQKLIAQFPNLHWLCSSSEEDIQDCVGKVTGSKLYKFIRNNDLITVEWQNGGSKSKLSKETEKSLKSNPGKSSEVLNKPEKNLKHDVLKLIQDHPKGIDYERVCESYVKFGGDDREFYKTVKDLMYNGEVYEPRIGLLVATNPLQSSSANQKQNLSRIAEDPTLNSTDDESTAQKALESDEVANLSDSNLGTENKASNNLVKPTEGPNKVATVGEGGSTPPADTLQSSTKSDDQPKTFLKPFDDHNPLPSAVSNDEFKANPKWKDVVEYIRRGKNGRTLDEVERYFGFSKDYCFEALNKLKSMKKIWFNNASLRFEFGVDKNPAPLMADEELNIGV